MNEKVKESCERWKRVRHEEMETNGQVAKLAE
jgi:hypothetical protein